MPLEFYPLSHDYKDDGVLTAADVDALAADVKAIADRALIAFDIDVVIVDDATTPQILSRLAANGNEGPGSNDAYVLVMDVQSNNVEVINPLIPRSVGRVNAFGLAAEDDLLGRFANGQDEVAVVFADTLLAEVASSQTVADFNADLSQSLARTAIHEALHTFPSFIRLPSHLSSHWET